MNPRRVAFRCTSSLLRRLLRAAVFVVLSSLVEESLASSSTAAGTETLVGIVGPDFVVLGADSSLSTRGGSIAWTASHLDKIAVVREGNSRRPSQQDEPDEEAFQRPPPQSRCTVIAAAAVGDAADTDRLVGLLKAHATIREYESTTVGCDVHIVDGSRTSTTTKSASQTRRHDHLLPSTRRTLPQLPFSGGLTVQDTAYLARSLIAQQLRSRQPYQVCLFVAGMTTATTPHPTNTLAGRQRQYPLVWSPSSLPSSSSSTAASATTRLQPQLFWLDEYGAIQPLLYGVHGYASHLILSILDQQYRPNLTRSEAIALIRQCFEQLQTRYVLHSPHPPCIKCIDATGCHRIQDG